MVSSWKEPRNKERTPQAISKRSCSFVLPKLCHGASRTKASEPQSLPRAADVSNLPNAPAVVRRRISVDPRGAVCRLRSSHQFERIYRVRIGRFPDRLRMRHENIVIRIRQGYVTVRSLPLCVLGSGDAAAV